LATGLTDTKRGQGFPKKVFDDEAQKIYIEFKREAVRLIESSEKPSTDVARQLGVRRNQLYKRKEPLDKRGAERSEGWGGVSSGISLGL
jgi:transposase-like protein